MLGGNGAMLTELLAFVHRLRDAGLGVSMVEALDATRALGAIDLARRPELKAALAATLVKRAEHRTAFDTLFDLHFPLRRAASVAPVSRPAPAPRSDESGEAEPASGDLLAALADALRRDDRDALRALADLAVEQFGGIAPDRPASPRYYLYRVFRRLDLSNLLRRTVQDDRDAGGARGPLGDRLAHEEQARRLEAFRQLIGESVRERLLLLGGPREASALYGPALIEDVDFLSASPDELRQMRRAVEPLARKLAARVARRRRRRREGRLDVRRTVRRSLSAGGVPLDPAFRRRRASRPDVYLLCDISGSVAEFARFTITLMSALGDAFSRLRAFAFVDEVDEVTAILARRPGALAVTHLLATADVVGPAGHSDYGAVFDRFLTRYAGALGPRATLIITGDARNNYRAPGLASLRAIADRARRVYWLNPEPRERWGTTDSIIAAYASCCDAVHEARNLRQLAAFVRDVV
jgi:uncharacterized protein with von Willebrand factor type A (vWA) domain